jgi:hypothetical protein
MRKSTSYSSLDNIIPSWALRIRPLPATLLLVSAAIGATILMSLMMLTLVPLVLLVGGLVLWMVVSLLLGWAGIEVLAAGERWMERDPRFQR